MKTVKLDIPVTISEAPYPIEQVFKNDLLPNLSESLDAGKKIKTCGLLPRELLGLIVSSSLITVLEKVPYTLGVENPSRFDGVILRKGETKKKRGTRNGLFFEQVYLTQRELGKKSFSDRLTDAMSKKLSYGAQYAKNMNLIILVKEKVPNEELKLICNQFPYEMIILINVLNPIPFLFDIYLVKNTTGDIVGGPYRISIDKLSGIRQVQFNSKQYLIIGDQVVLSSLPMQLSWRISQ